MAIGKNINLKRDKVIPAKKKSENRKGKAKKNEVPDSANSTLKVKELEVVSTKALDISDIQEKDFSMTIVASKRKKVRKVNIELSGDISIKNMEKISTTFDQLKKEYDLIDVLLMNIDKLDLTTIQMLYMNSVLHHDEKRQVKVISELPNDLKQLIQINGFLDFMFEYKR